MRTQKPKSRGTAARPVKSRRTSFSQLERSKQQWVQDIDAISDFIVVHDRDWKIVRTNRSLADHLGLPPVALVGEAVSRLRQLAEGDGTFPCPFCLYTGLSKEEHIISSSDKIYLVSTSRTSGATEDDARTIHVLKDITDRREAERRYRELYGGQDLSGFDFADQRRDGR